MYHSSICIVFLHYTAFLYIFYAELRRSFFMFFSYLYLKIEYFILWHTACYMQDIQTKKL